MMVSSSYFSALAVALGIFLLLGLAYYGWGRVLFIILGVDRKTPSNFTMPIWLGWAFTLFLFQVVHFVFPITGFTAIPVFMIGIYISIPRLINQLRSILRHPKPLISTRLKTTVLIISFLVVSVWVVSKAMLSPLNGDSGLYHFTAIRWINTYPIVPGLGNLHGRLAFNQSFFVYVAALNFYPFFGYGRSIANSFLFLVLVVDIFITLGQLLSRPALLKKHPFHFAPNFFIIPILAYIALGTGVDGLASPTPDFTSTLLQLAIFVEFAHGIAKWLDGNQDQDNRALLIAILSATALTIKLSNLAISVAMIGIVLIYLWKTSNPTFRGLARIILPVFVLLLVWAVRGFILSGAPFYPSGLGYIPVDWAVPKNKVIAEAHSIIGWARVSDSDCCYGYGNWDWVKTWFLKTFKNPRNIGEVLYPLSAFLVFFILDIGIARYLKIRKLSPRFFEWIIFLPAFLSLVFWFITAPDPRFAFATFWILSICSALIFLSLLRQLAGRNSFGFSFIIVFAVTNLYPICYLGLSSFFVHNPLFAGHNISTISLSGWQPVMEVLLIKRTTDSGLVVNIPGAGEESCWDSTLPCTPYFIHDLKLRNPMNIASGFICDAACAAMITR